MLIKIINQGTRTDVNEINESLIGHVFETTNEDLFTSEVTINPKRINEDLGETYEIFKGEYEQVSEDYAMKYAFEQVFKRELDFETLIEEKDY